MKNEIEHCKYCNTPLPKNHRLKESICDSCYDHRRYIRWFMEQTQPLREVYNRRLKEREEQRQERIRALKERKSNV